MQREHFSLFTDFACDHLDSRLKISILLASFAAFAPNGPPRSFPPWGYCAADRAVALFLSSKGGKKKPFERSLWRRPRHRERPQARPRKQRALATRFAFARSGGVDVTRLSARFGGIRAKGHLRSGDREIHDRGIHPRGARNPIGNAVRPSRARSASASPITGANLKPWPLKPHATATFANSGCRPTTKCPSRDMVYMQ